MQQVENGISSTSHNFRSTWSWYTIHMASVKHFTIHNFIIQNFRSTWRVLNSDVPCFLESGPLLQCLCQGRSSFWQKSGIWDQFWKLFFKAFLNFAFPDWITVKLVIIIFQQHLLKANSKQCDFNTGATVATDPCSTPRWSGQCLGPALQTIYIYVLIIQCKFLFPLPFLLSLAMFVAIARSPEVRPKPGSIVRLASRPTPKRTKKFPKKSFTIMVE